MTTLLTVYLQLNLLLVLSWVLWKTIRGFGKLVHVEPGHQQTLLLARMLFLSLPLVLLLSHLLDGIAHQTLPSAIGGLTITPIMAQGLAQNVQVSGKSVTLASVLIALMMIGLLVGVWRFAEKLRSLRSIIDDAVAWKIKANVSVLVSEAAATPFSTSVLGRNIVILPYGLVHSPNNFHIALKHELQHLRNGDLNWVVMMEVVKLFCYWNPFIYCWQNEFDCLQEFACDEALVNRGCLTTQRYGRCLLEVASTIPEKRLLATSNMVPKFSLWMKAESQLRRRISMLKVKQKRKFDQVRVAVFGSMMTLGLLLSSALWLTENSVAQEERKETILPVTTRAPVYPRQALDNNLEGWVLTEFTVTDEGTVANAAVVEDCIVAGGAEWAVQVGAENLQCLGEYEALFNQSALDAIYQFTFETQGRDVERVQYVFGYRLDKEE